MATRKKKDDLPMQPWDKQPTDERGAFGDLGPASEKAQPSKTPAGSGADDGPKVMPLADLMAQLSAPSVFQPAPSETASAAAAPQSQQPVAGGSAGRPADTLDAVASLLSMDEAPSPADAAAPPPRPLSVSAPVETAATRPVGASTPRLAGLSVSASAAPPRSAAPTRRRSRRPARPAAGPRPRKPAPQAPLGAAPYKKKTSETSHGVLIMIALIISLLVHMAAGVMIGRYPLVEMYMAAMAGEAPAAQEYRVQPLQEDPIYRDQLLASAILGEGGVGISSPRPAEEPVLSDLAKTLLATRNEPAASLTPPPPPSATIAKPGAAGSASAGDPSRTLDQPIRQPDAQRPKVADEAPKIDLPAEVTARLAGGVSVSVPSTPIGGSGTSGGTGGVGLPPSTAGQAPSLSAEASTLLKAGASADFGTGTGNVGAGGTGVGFGPGAAGAKSAGPVANRPPVPVVDHRLLEAAAAPPPIEAAAITIREAIKLEVPERLDEDFDYTLAKFRPAIKGGLFESDKPDKYSYFRLDIDARRSLRKLKTMPKDVVFVLDVSGSISQEWVAAASQGVRDALGSLNEGDRFNICLFSEKPVIFNADKIQDANAASVAAAATFLATAKSGGDTDVNRAISRLIVRDVGVQRAYYLVLVSDGVPTRGVMDTRELINLITRDNDLNASIYCVGIGSQQNRELLNYLAYRNKGFSVFAKDVEAAPGAIRDLVSRVRYPIIKDVALNIVGLEMNEVFPHHLPNIHQGERFSVYGRFVNPVLFTLRISGNNGQRAMDLTHGGDLLTAAVGDNEIPQMWGFWKLHHLYSEIIRQGERPELKDQIKELKDRFDLKVLY